MSAFISFGKVAKVLFLRIFGHKPLVESIINLVNCG